MPKDEGFDTNAFESTLSLSGSMKEENVSTTEAGEGTETSVDDILCKDGPFLRVFQLSDLYQDSKYLPDRPMKTSPCEVLDAFYALQNYSKSDLQKFLDKYFDEAGSDLEPWTPPDLNANPQFLSTLNLNASEIQTAQEALHVLGCLGRKVKMGILPSAALRRTLIDIPHGFIIPGGRFRELYYWDSYWIIRGLIISGMFDTAKGMIFNFCQLISRYGFIPNGLRKYYLDRSQPPMFVLMVSAYFKATKDIKFLQMMYPYIEREYSFWVDAKNKHMVCIELEDDLRTVKSISTTFPDDKLLTDSTHYILNRYYSRKTEPRPESYKEDILIRQMFADDPSYASYVMQCLRAAGESGWDFSSRWYKVSERLRWSLENIDTLNVLPIDLNALLYILEIKLAEWALLQTDRTEKEISFLNRKYSEAAIRRHHVMKVMMWDAENARWCDYLCREKTLCAIPNLSSMWPLWAGMTDDIHDMERAVSFLLEHSGLWREWGLAPTAINSGQQWDLPNGWPPLSQVVLEFMVTSPIPEARLFGKQMVERCIESIVQAFRNHGSFYEKYSTEVCGSHGSGGEYVTQVGFGWTNAIFLEWMKYKSMGYDPESIKHDLLIPCTSGMKQNDSSIKEDISPTLNVGLLPIGTSS